MCKKILFLLLCAGQALAQEASLLTPFKDPQDGQLDASEWLLERKGFLPLPIIITEPAVGYGAGMALAFFRESIREAAQQSGRVTPPDIYLAAFAATENGTKFGGVGGRLTFEQDRWRYRGFAGLIDANLDFYGSSGVLGVPGRSASYNLEGLASSQQVMRRLWESDHFIAARWVYLDLLARFEPGGPQPQQLRDARSSGLGLAFEYDTRDNIFTPSRGLNVSLDSVFYAPALGGDTKFQTYRAFVFAYQPLGRELVLGGRLDNRAARGDVPFYQLPFIQLRGIPVLRYQGDNVAVAEAELRWNATPRWALMGFYGAGRAWDSGTSLSNGELAHAGGIGVRYLIARRLGLYLGLDLARGPEDTAIYLQVGSAWR